MTSTPTGARQNNDLSRTTLPRIPAQPIPGKRRRPPQEALPRYGYERYSRLAGPSAYSGHQAPAFGPPLQSPSDSPGRLIQR